MSSNTTGLLFLVALMGGVVGGLVVGLLWVRMIGAMLRRADAGLRERAAEVRRAEAEVYQRPHGPRFNPHPPTPKPPLPKPGKSMRGTDSLGPGAGTDAERAAMPSTPGLGPL